MREGAPGAGTRRAARGAPRAIALPPPYRRRRHVAPLVHVGVKLVRLGVLHALGDGLKRGGDGWAGGQSGEGGRGRPRGAGAVARRSHHGCCEGEKGAEKEEAEARVRSDARARPSLAVARAPLTTRAAPTPPPGAGQDRSKRIQPPRKLNRRSRPSIFFFSRRAVRPPPPSCLKARARPPRRTRASRCPGWRAWRRRRRTPSPAAPSAAAWRPRPRPRARGPTP